VSQCLVFSGTTRGRTATQAIHNHIYGPVNGCHHHFMTFTCNAPAIRLFSADTTHHPRLPAYIKRYISHNINTRPVCQLTPTPPFTCCNGAATTDTICSCVCEASPGDTSFLWSRLHSHTSPMPIICQVCLHSSHQYRPTSLPLGGWRDEHK